MSAMASASVVIAFGDRGAIEKALPTVPSRRSRLRTYLGTEAATAMLGGRVRLGDVARIRAVVVVCDLLEFTSLTERLDPQSLIDRLNPRRSRGRCRAEVRAARASLHDLNRLNMDDVRRPRFARGSASTGATSSLAPSDRQAASPSRSSEPR